MDMRWFEHSMESFERDHGTLVESEAIICFNSPTVELTIAGSPRFTANDCDDVVGYFNGYALKYDRDLDPDQISFCYHIDGENITRIIQTYEPASGQEIENLTYGS